MDASFTAVTRYTGHVLGALGWGTHNLAPLYFRGADYSGVFTVLPLLIGRGREHHGHILSNAAALVESGQLVPRLHPTSSPLHTRVCCARAPCRGPTSDRPAKPG
ncbi:hypothetical protein [Mycolicibacterium tokaiense]|uniref:hypothetical protein n=1 Tax=Mycolicibacterium tokaiense TaxID=39695 RepID=UPI001E3E3283|nr:hypothetical protein [Mycolicibacterium tokaiense]